VEPSPGWYRPVSPRELWGYREVALALARRQLQARYKQTALGVSWVALQPLLGVAIFSVVFGQLVGMPSDGLPYPLFVFVGLMVWSYFSLAVDAATRGLVDDRELVTKTYFPRLLSPISAVIPPLADLAVSLLVLPGLMVVYSLTPSPAVIALPALVVALVALALAVGLWLSALYVQFRDVGHGLGTLLQLWLFASPVVFPSSLADGRWRYLLAANPITGLIDGFRWSLLGAPAPVAADLLSVAVGVGLLASGIAYFQRLERRFADLI